MDKKTDSQRPEEVAPAISALLNLCLETTHFPDCWKHARICTISKIPGTQLLCEFKPISIFPVMNTVVVLASKAEKYILLSIVNSAELSGISWRVSSKNGMISYPDIEVPSVQFCHIHRKSCFGWTLTMTLGIHQWMYAHIFRNSERGVVLRVILWVVWMVSWWGSIRVWFTGIFLISCFHPMELGLDCHQQLTNIFCCKISSAETVLQMDGGIDRWITRVWCFRTASGVHSGRTLLGYLHAFCLRSWSFKGVYHFNCLFHSCVFRYLEVFHVDFLGLRESGIWESGIPSIVHPSPPWRNHTCWEACSKLIQKCLHFHHFVGYGDKGAAEQDTCSSGSKKSPNSLPSTVLASTDQSHSVFRLLVTFKFKGAKILEN